MTSLPPERPDARRRRLTALCAAVLGTALALAPAASATSSAPSTAEEVTDLGIAMQAPNVRLSHTGVLPDGTPVAYLFSDGEPVSFNVVDLRTGGLIDSHEIPPYSVASSIDVAADGTVYLSVRSPNDATLWRYEPGSGELATVAGNIADEQMLRTIDIDGDTLYGATYPNAQVFTMDLTTEEITELGSVTDEGDYAWGLDATDGRVWVGAGTPAQLYSVDPMSGDSAVIELPGDVAASGEFIQRIESFGELTFVTHRTVEEANTLVHDGNDWIDRLLVGGMWLYTDEAVDGVMYYLDSAGTPHAFDLDSRSSTAIDLSGTGIEGETSGTTRIFLAELGTADHPGTTLVGPRTDGQIWRYNLATGEGDVLSPDAFGSAVTIMSIAEGGDGHVYLGAYLSPGVMARIDTTTGQVEQLDGPEQADAIVAHGDRTVIGTYPNAGFYATEGDEPWEWGANPGHLFTLGRAESGQDRPRHMTAAGDLVAAGTIPNYGELGGALTLFDPETGQYETHRDVVPDQSVTDLAYRDGVIYGGTSIHGGLDSTPTQSTAELFVWDIDDGLLTSGPVDENAEIIHALTVDGAGRLWGMTDTGVLFEYDTTAHEVRRTVDTGIRHSNVWGTQSELNPNPDDGLVYGNAGSRLFRFDPEEPELEILVSSGVQRSAVAGGDVYFTDETNVFRYEIDGSESELVTVVPEPVTFTDGDVDAPGTFTVPATEGVEYVAGPLPSEAASDATGVLAPGVHPGEGMVFIHARALEGFVIAEGAQTEWSHEFGSGVEATPTASPSEAPTATAPAPVTPSIDSGGDASADEIDGMPATGSAASIPVILAGVLLILGLVLRVRRSTAIA